jgi:hypothetical protein
MNLSNKIGQIGVLTAFSLLALFSCKKLEIDKIASTAWNPSIAMPLAYGNWGVSDIFARTNSNDLVVTDPNTGAISLIYTGELASLVAKDLVELPDQSASAQLSGSDLGLSFTPAYSGTATMNNTEFIPFSANAGVELHTMKFVSGNLNLMVSTTLQHDVTIVLTFPDLKVNGVPVSKTITLIYSGTIPQNGSATINLAGAILDMTTGTTGFNEVKVDIKTTVNGTGNIVTGTENINFNFNLSTLDFDNVVGYFGQQNLALANDTIAIKLFQNATEGTFQFSNPKIRILVDNSIGVPLNFSLSNLKTINTNDGSEYVLSGYPTPILINYPTVQGQSAKTSIELNKTNTTNIASLFNPTPKDFLYKLDAVMNPGGPAAQLNFIKNTSRVKVNVELELPLEGYASGFAVKDTADFSFTENVDDIESITFRVSINNGFPVNVNNQVTFLDENYNPLFTLFDSVKENMIKSAEVDGNGKVNKSTKKITDIKFTKDKLVKMKEVKHILLYGDAQTLDGENGKSVKFYDTYKISMNLGMQLQLKVNL